MTEIKGSMLASQKGESIVGGITIELPAIKKMTMKQIKRNLRLEIRALEEDLMKEVKRARSK